MFLKNPSIRDRREKWMLFFVWSQSVWPSVTFPVRLRNPRCPCGIVFFFNPCTYTLPLFACTACTRRSSTSAPGIGTAGSTRGSVCYGHAHSRWRRSSCPCGTSVLTSLPSTCWPGRSWASPRCAAGQRCVRKARLWREVACGAARPHLSPGWWRWPPWVRSRSAASAPCRFCEMAPADANTSAPCRSLTRRGTYRSYPRQP